MNLSAHNEEINQVDELVIKGKNTGEWNHVWIKDFQNGSYNINLPELIVSH